ncbi:hypothetical protein C900_02398 [Fulvivirga imtechensis AK7]|uniref:Uncharacterized protein n=1 Tax=Fulvivirga imtechensis AK7 TaxID=1237149 RepID=L8JWT1_9BACT|nr:hypothetical protein [Fulvivirga imtechensis]ELR71662.1 hypothetical protein C900_02398 [Fulvivirga imtechensis AK7]
MRLLRVILAGAIGTTAMTAFSYAISAARGKQFREPELLNKLTRRIEERLEIRRRHNDVEGWLMHYLVGLLFSTIYDQLWQKSRINTSFFKSLAMGGVTGVFGVSIWHLTFKMHPNPPKIHLKEFYVQLLVAHVIFGVFSSWDIE